MSNFSNICSTILISNSTGFKLECFSKSSYKNKSAVHTGLFLFELSLPLFISLPILLFASTNQTQFPTYSSPLPQYHTCACLPAVSRPTAWTPGAEWPWAALCGTPGPACQRPAAPWTAAASPAAPAPARCAPAAAAASWALSGQSADTSLEISLRAYRNYCAACWWPESPSAETDCGPDSSSFETCLDLDFELSGNNQIARFGLN